jgi:FkbM family methyltransferase
MAYKAAWLRAKFPDVAVHQVALAETPGQSTFHIDPQKSGFSGLHQHGDGASAAITVECARLDDLIPEDLGIGFIKIDVEGGELGAFKGMRRVLSEGRPVILFECTRSGLAASGTTAEQVYAFLSDESRYDVYMMLAWLEGGAALDLTLFDRAMTYPFRAFNFVAVPR